METKVVYYSKSGNTKKLADCIAKTAGCWAEKMEKGASVKADVLFLGASVYKYGVDPEVKKFIAELDPKKVKEVVVFSTSALAERAFPDIKKLLDQKQIKVAEENFYCRGEFLFMHKGRPNKQDLQDVEKFTRDVLSKRG